MSTQMNANATTQQTTAAIAVPTLMQTSLALVFGVTVLFAAGFLPLEVAHNAAHDLRHALAFPCH